MNLHKSINLYSALKGKTSFLQTSKNIHYSLHTEHYRIYAGKIMNKYIKVISMLLALSSSIYLPSTFAATTTSSTEMLITLAETDPVLIDRLNELALNDEKLLNQILKMSENDPVKLERLVNLAENDPVMFWKLANIYNAQQTESTTTKLQPVEEQQMYSTFGTIDDSGGIIQN